ncbi:hypothetical protein MF621_004061 (plasmid) [Bacillus velezensis]|uniref:hypothetical protein n=1 Tax=Bacillus velezensis TaxID=492670 RepID=UPI0004A0A2C3|nr:hypothetical protein [Bacillus velezensis]KDN91171.1 hypothetical protein EF87_20370 [Bacillus amyloliquefaciens]URJ76355.1 hypothetical protein MF619_004099 [Bacillus velezensis]URJ80475.1 hypothetical protein MF621_004061 [Bacillus velezensis]
MLTAKFHLIDRRELFVYTDEFRSFKELAKYCSGKDIVYFHNKYSNKGRAINMNKVIEIEEG